MATSIIEKILGNNNLYTNNYITDVINLTKSIVIKSTRKNLVKLFFRFIITVIYGRICM